MLNDPVTEALDLLRRVRLVSVVRATRVADPLGLAQTALAAQAPVLEFTLTTEGALAAIREAVRSGAVVGAGTVLSRADAEAALEAGARFIVSPTVEEEVIETALEARVPVFPGALSPTEVRRAVELGATAVKVFPAGLGGPGYLRELGLVFPSISLLPSGGINAGNAAAFLEAGALAVSAGAGVLVPTLVESGDNDAIAARLEEMIDAIGSGVAR